MTASTVQESSQGATPTETRPQTMSEKLLSARNSANKDNGANQFGPGSKTNSTTVSIEDEDVDEVASQNDNDTGHRFANDETVMIFDWDDTVLPSSWVQEQGLRLDGESPLSAVQKEELAALAKLTTETLRMAKRLGTVVLVTNAERGWIELSCQKFLPSLYPVLENVKQISARSEYERPDLPSPFEWKLRAFESEIGRLFPRQPGDEPRRKNILSFGDGVHEREALIHATAQLHNCRTKSLKFVERPRIEQLRKQHALLARCVKRIVHHDGNLDLCLKSAKSL